jgi:hypothetical protein
MNTNIHNQLFIVLQTNANAAGLITKKGKQQKSLQLVGEKKIGIFVTKR